MNDECGRVRHESADRMQTLIEHLPDDTARAVEWSLYTGCRKFETFGLLWENVFIQDRRATVIKKGGKQHTVWLSDQALELLERCPRAGRYVFNKEGARYRFNAACQKIGLEDFRWHDLRHTAATWLRQKGVPVEVVQRILGHADVTTTMRYAHVADTEVQEAMNLMPKLAGGSSNVVRLRRTK